MPEPPKLPKLEDPLASLRGGIAAHAATVEAAKQAGAELQAAKQTSAESTGEPGAP